MAKVSSTTLRILRRAYSVATGSRLIRVKGDEDQAAAASSGMRKVIKDQEDGKLEKVDVFWMRDPGTGCWIPETHFNQDAADPADLRHEFLFRNKNPKSNHQ